MSCPNGLHAYDYATQLCVHCGNRFGFTPKQTGHVATTADLDTGKVYMAADQNDAGVTVEDHNGSVHVQARFTHAYFSTAEARAVVEGLLRRMLEKDGQAASVAWFLDVQKRWVER